MTDFMKVLKETPLASGSHGAEDGQGCVMEKVSILWALHTGQDVAATFSDLPECTNYVISKAAQYVNDTVDDETRQRLNRLIPRLLRARRTDSDARINVRLAIFAARSVLHLVDDPNSRAGCEKAIEAAEVWLENPSEETAATANAAATAAADSVVFLDSLLDAWEEACTKENEDLYIPREWEDEALAFVAEWMES